jgi:hypothetical protein
MTEQALPVVRIVDRAERFDRVRTLLTQWHRAKGADIAPAQLEFLAAAETYFMMGRSR